MTSNSTNPLKEFSDELWAQSSISQIINRAMTRPDAPTFKFTGDMVEASKPLWDWAEYVIDHYEGDWNLMVEFRTKQRIGVQMSKNQLAVALNSLLNCWRRSLKWTAPQAERTYPTSQDLFDAPVKMADIPTREPAQIAKILQTPRGNTVIDAPAEMVVKVKIPNPGTYTFVDHNGDYRVVKFSHPDKKIDNGNMYVSYQYGSDNVSDFAKCGVIDKDGVLKVWGSAFRRGEAVQKHSAAQRADLFAAIVFICSFDREAQLKAGEAYALEAKCCFVCGRQITVPSSISAGMGPICAERWQA